MKPSTKKVLITGAAGVAFIAAGAVPALAAPQTGLRHPGGISGTVSSVSTTTLVLAGTNGTNYSVDVSGASLFKGVLDAKPTKIALTDIKVGDSVAVMGPVAGSTVTARVIFDGPVPAGAHEKQHVPLGTILVGSISSLTGATLSVTPTLRGATTTAPAVTVTTTASTTVVKDGKTAALADLSAGEHVLVSGTKNADGTITASKLMVRTQAALGGFLGHGKGKGNDHDNDD